jgi:sulfatase modifying factor 1
MNSARFSPARLVVLATLLLGTPTFSPAGWLTTGEPQIEVHKKSGISAVGGPLVVLSYTLPESEISADLPAYVFVHSSADEGVTWQRVPRALLQGDVGLVEAGGARQIQVWGADQVLLPDPAQLRFRVRAIAMARVPAGDFTRRTLPARGVDESDAPPPPEGPVPLFYLARHETTISMYVDFLNEVGGRGAGWNEKMANSEFCGILRTDSAPGYRYAAAPGREEYPVTTVSWYAAQAFLDWCGLRMPTELEWEKAIVGGNFLDGDAENKIPNPLPDRAFPWGNEPLQTPEGKFRCNIDGKEDGYAATAPVGSFPTDRSPYGIFDLAGNVAEWTGNWYTTGYHIGADGFRIMRGPSWTTMADAVDVVAQPTLLPRRGLATTGIRCAWSPSGAAR